MNIATAVADAKAVKSVQPGEKSQDIDPAEILPWLPCTLALDISSRSFYGGQSVDA